MMELQHTHASIGRLETVHDSKLEQAVDGDVTLPEYCPDILRILKSQIEPAVTSVQQSGDRVSIDGFARVQVLYITEDGTLQSYEQNYPFTRTAELGGLGDDIQLQVRAKTEFANGRAVSQRRLDIHGMLSLRVVARRRKEEQILTALSGGGLQTLSHTVSCSSLEAVVSHAFPLSEVLELRSDAPPVDQIMHRHAALLLTEVKAIKNKVLLKGTLEVQIVYSSRGTAEPQHTTHSMPISQIIEAPGVTEATRNRLQLHLSSLELLPKADSSGAARLLEINARVSAELFGYHQLELTLVKDAYSTLGSIVLENRRIELRQISEEVSFENFTVRERYDLPGGARALHLVSGELLPYECVVRDEALHITGKVKYHIIYTDSEGQLTAIDRELPLAFRRGLKVNTEGSTKGGEVDAGEGTPAGKRGVPAPVASLALSLLKTQPTLSGDLLELKAELSAAGELSLNESLHVVGAVSPSEEEEAPLQRAPLTIYFTGEGEPLWEIAKRYRTTTEAIGLENDLEGEQTEPGQMLLIPACN